MKRYLGDGMLLVTAFVWGSGFVVTAIAIEHLTPFQVMAGRFLLATVILSVLFGYKFKKMTKTVIWKGVIIGAFLYLGFVLQTYGLEYTTPSKNAFLTAINVIIVPLIGYFIYKKAIDRHELIGAFLTVVGIAFLSLQQDTFTINLGDTLTILCAFAFAFDIYYTNVFVQKEDAIALTIVQFITATCLSIVGMFILGQVPTSLEKEAIYSVIYLAIFSTTLAYVFQNIGHKYTTPTRAAIILSLEAFFGTLLSVLILKEILTTRMIIGAVLIMAAILIAELKPTLRKSTMKKVS